MLKVQEKSYKFILLLVQGKLLLEREWSIILACQTIAQLVVLELCLTTSVYIASTGGKKSLSSLPSNFLLKCHIQSLSLFPQREH